MKLEDIGFYTLSDARAKFVAENYEKVILPITRCEIIITDKCNFSCPYCRGIDCEETDLKTIESTMIELKNIMNIRFSGGEPTLHPDIEEMVKIAKLMSVQRIAISTNGSLPFEKYKTLVDLGVNDFSISLDACCASTGDMMTGGVEGSWKIVTENIKRLSEITYITVGIVITEDNISEVNKIIAFADSLGVSDIRVIPSAQYNKFLRELKTLDPKLYENRPILKYRVENASVNGHVRGLLENDSTRCPLVLDDIAVMGDNHYPCIIYMREKGKPIGKISDGRIKINEDRTSWFKTHQTHLDPICKKNCLDVCIEYNNKCNAAMKG